MEEVSNSTESTIMTALSTLTPPQLSDLTHSISSLLRHHRRRLSSLLSSPTLFSLTLHHLHSLSLHHKSLLIARHLFSTLTHLTQISTTKITLPPLTATTLRDLDAALLLLLLCELRQHDPEALEVSPTKWRQILCHYCSNTMLTLSGLGVSDGEVLFEYVEVVAKCKRFVGVMGGGGKEGRELAASVAAVVALAAVEVSGAGRECVICKEEMREGRDVCELPCEHLFHWMCILPWLRKRNTCPCCRYRLPTDDVFVEIERLWEVVVKMGGGRHMYGGCT
ncbi:E3 ubiquitin-protein ligase SGR9, amyloplastic [Cornus florida]|uniref:E3 ubiquitin-protein ligase SGR9, amyloplastic n=1 Tax=Cornus florida TaxID=4283 RepID=UPI0028A0E659|nr:E3 ubiquitin-protein ligase SGR9, amyloplastic [Cornus florida]